MVMIPWQILIEVDTAKAIQAEPVVAEAEDVLIGPRVEFEEREVVFSKLVKVEASRVEEGKVLVRYV